MEPSRPTLGEVVGASMRMAQRAVDLGSNRLELLVVELHEERERLLLTLTLALGVTVLALLAGFAFTLGVMVLLWDHSPVIALAVLTVLYSAGAVFLYARVVRLQRACEMFSATLDQCRKDRECLIHNLH